MAVALDSLDHGLTHPDHRVPRPKETLGSPVPDLLLVCLGVGVGSGGQHLLVLLKQSSWGRGAGSGFLRMKPSKPWAYL